MVNTKEKRTVPEDDNNNSNKRQKSNRNNENTIPILRGRFKQRWLTKHSHLLKRSDEANGILVSCAVNAETRALGQISNCLEYYITKLFPDHKTTWVRFEGKLDIDQLDFEEEEEEQEEKKEEDMTKEKERKEKKFQAIDAACGGLVFYRFRVNVKPTEFIIKLMDYIKQLPDKEREQELAKVRHCSRWIPFDYICPATTERIKSCFERVKEDHFMNTCTTSITVAIITDIRNNILITKDEIIQTIAPLIPPNYKVNLSKPTLVIYVSVFKSVCGITVLKEYFERKKYNLISYCCQQKK